MRFLIDADLPRSVAPLLSSFGHEAIDVRDIGLRTADDPTIAEYARSKNLCLITGDFGFADVRAYPPEQYAGLVVLQLSRHATEQTILMLVEELLRQPALLSRVPSRLAMVKIGRVRLRPE